MAILRTQGMLILFGFVIMISLFLGDGKQPAIDVVWACEILLLYAIYHVQNRKLFVLPRTLQIAWVLLLGYCIVCSIFSDSVGYSLSTVIRLFDAYLVYRLFYSIADKKHTRHVVLGVIIVGVVATIVSFGCLLFPRFVSWLPQMNLLYASYGHNQLAGLLLFGFPLVIAGGAPLPAWCKKTALILFLAGMVFSFARGAWILLVAYFTFLLVTKRLVGKFNASVVIVFMGAVAGLLVATFLLAPRFAHDPPTMNNDWFYKQTIKPSIYENRVQYWLQALRAIQERPIFGSGPGTFYLQSKRLQAAPLSYSWFAHSFVLEQLVEVGLVGTVLWGILFLIQGRLLIRSRDNALFAGIILTFLYGLYEYNLNFLIIWLLFWSALGWLTGSLQPKKTPPPHFSFPVMGCMAFLFLFSLFSIAGAVEATSNNINAASLFTPFVADTVLTSIEKHTETTSPIPQKFLSLWLFFHRKNPEILYAIAKYYGAMNQPNDAARWYLEALRLDPKNFEYNKEYLELVVKKAALLDTGQAVQTISLNMLPDRLHSEIISIDFASPFTHGVDVASALEQLTVEPWETYFPKIYYKLGIVMLNKDAGMTKRLWMLARDSYPNMGLLYQELAALELYVFGDLQTAKKIIADCMKTPHADLHCRQITLNLDNIPPPGTIEREVLTYEQ